MEINYISQLSEYIIKNVSKGYAIESLKVALINQGYSKISIDKAADLAIKKMAEKAPEMKEKPEITYKLVDENNNPIKLSIENTSKKPWWKFF